LFRTDWTTAGDVDRRSNMRTLSSFTTTLCIPTTALSPDYVRLVNSRFPDCDPLGPTDTVDDVEVEVEYSPGWFQAGRYSGPPDSCYPDEGEDPVIESVVIQDPDFEHANILADLPAKLVEALVTEAWDHQKGSEQDHYDEPDYDPEPCDGPY
jgi:hypothetical protein